LKAVFWILCFEFVSDFVLRVSDLLDGWTFINSKMLDWRPPGDAPLISWLGGAGELEYGRSAR
jgi:hypothetical protein